MASSFKKRIENIEKKFEYSKNITDKSRLLSQNAHGCVTDKNLCVYTSFVSIYK